MIEVGLVGKPNAGKSSFFKAATMVEVEISNRPFTTIDANVGIAYVSFDCVCKELGIKCNPQDGFCMNGIRFAPIKLIDVAGLVPEAHKGKGLGNKFLDDVRKAEALIHVVDFSGKTDEFGNPTENHNPLDDITFLEREIELWFKSIIEKNLGKLMKFKDRDELIDFLLQKLSGLEIERVHLERALEKTDIDNTEEFAHWLRIFSKPIVIAANKMDLPEAQENFDRLKDRLKDRTVIPTSADAEIALKLAAKMKLIEYIPGRTFKIIDEMNEQQRKALNKISD
ncbi:MAG: 50S ribosome-binding GTPase, partial [Candidatus Aenigmarchaeota archaeon]|nr:50S ribosome-binding GTPase [Candidatus Aenigmarchaeota archaeon]